MQKNRLLIALLALGMTSIPAMAQLTPAQEISQISEEVALLNARKARLVLQTEIAVREQEMSRSAGGISNLHSKEFQALPVVRGIEGIDGRLSATLAWPGGTEQVVRQGEKISNGWHVSGIDVRSVNLRRGSENVRLVFGAEPPQPHQGMSGYAPQLPNQQTVGR